MRFSTTTLLLTSSLTTMAAPLLNAKGPWQISHFKSFVASPGPTGVSSISFDFYDPSTNFRTKCHTDLAPGSGRAPYTDNYISCDDSHASYIYDGKSLGIEFHFEDPSVGQPDFVTEWGQNNVTTHCTTSYAGQTCKFDRGAKLYITPDRAIAK